MSYDPVKAARGAARKAHIDSGKPIVLWRGRPAKFKNRKKEASRKACRSKARDSE